METPRNDLIPLTQAAALIGVCTHTVTNWAKAGRATVVRVGPRRLFLSRSEVERLARGNPYADREAK